MNAQSLREKRAIVTGAGSGIGRATAIRFAQEGARVGLVEINEAAAAETGAMIAREGGEALILQADVSAEAEVAAAIKRTVDRWEGLDIVVANAAIQLFGQDARVDELDAAVWQRTLDVNLTGVFLTCKHGIKALLASGGGTVVCTASPTSVCGIARGFDAYTASKAGVLGLVRVMANDYAGEGIRVNAVVPGYTNTPLVTELTETDEDREAMLAKIPLGRSGTAEEVASAILFLASGEATYATGGALVVDGGMTAV